ncbi:hypothetical protein POX_h09824 [Penicillium oxalicum]|uniref:Uncharacterized protein n=1 Tax=Penicillium oxalicum (strain 114-2 / CGMCC 5302) TaxID=933388 RepID=S7ZLM0_PENO1|nr:hypothetical protein POX_h09824 [Penicillium oxalicum]EPS31545.1 hypothetical protein PDE_06500 [Penicillium oxalicum 114-2]KAI2786058.1 hypothetical protein POX_h09824 [Penicillium oxalicum]
MYRMESNGHDLKKVSPNGEACAYTPTTVLNVDTESRAWKVVNTVRQGLSFPFQEAQQIRANAMVESRHSPGKESMPSLDTRQTQGTPERQNRMSSVTRCVCTKYASHMQRRGLS